MCSSDLAVAPPDRGHAAWSDVLRGSRTMRRAIRCFTSLCLLIVAACAATTPVAPVGAHDLPLQIRSTSVPFKLDDKQADRIGRLRWRGGIAMTANSRNFGGVLGFLSWRGDGPCGKAT